MNNQQKAIYNYAINGITPNKRNPEIFDINYGGGKTPLSIFKKDMQDFMKAVIPLENDTAFTADFEKALQDFNEQGDITGLNAFLTGRAMIIVSNFKDVAEYINSAQNGIKLITSLNLDGHLDLDNAFDYYTRRPSYEDLYPSNENENNER